MGTNKWALPVLYVGISIVVFITSFLITVLPWQIAIALPVAILIICLVLSRPYIGVLVVAGLVYDVIPSRFIPELPVGSFKVRSFEIVSIITAVSVLLSMVRAKKQGEQIRFDNPNLLISLYIFVVTSVFISFMYGYIYKDNAMAMTELRMFFAVLFAPAYFYALSNIRLHEELPKILTGFGLVISLYVIAQSFFGVQVFGSRIDALEYEGSPDVVRTIVGSAAFVQGYALFWLLLNVKPKARFSLINFMLILVVILGLLGTYTRGVWVGACIGVFIVLLLRKGLLKATLAYVNLSLVLLAFVALIYPFQPRFVDAVYNRFTGIGNEISAGSSFGWRLRENDAAIKSIQNKPLLGTGLGGEYKFTKSAKGSFDVEYTYIHNSYLYYPLKMGMWAVAIPAAFLVYVCFMLVTSIRNRANFECLHSVIPCAGVFYMILQTAVTSPELHSFAGLFSVVLMTFIVTGYRAAEK